MDRRRRLPYVPASEDLEGRQLLASSNSLFGSSLIANYNQNNVQLSTLQDRTQRIERLPAFLQSLDPSRPLPDTLRSEITDDLAAMIGRLHPAPSAGLSDFNRQLRDLISHGSVQAESAYQLSTSFHKILLAAGAPTAAADRLTANLETLTQISVHTSRFPTTIVANNYAAVLQVALGVGRPLRAPAAPKLLPADDTGTKGDHATSVVQPRLVGTYDPLTMVRVLDDQGDVLGAAKVDAKGQYTVVVNTPLSVGTHTLYIQGVDGAGTESTLSPRYGLKIVPAVPRGPRAAQP